MRALGWEIGDQSYSIALYIGNDGKHHVVGLCRVIGPGTNTTLSNSDQQVEVEVENGRLVNVHAKDGLMAAVVWQPKVEQVHRTSC